MRSLKIKQSFSTLLLIVLCVICASDLFATSTITKPTAPNTQDFYKEIVDIQKQLNAIAQSGYLNHMNGQDNKVNAAAVTVFFNQIQRLDERLREYIIQPKIGKDEVIKAEKLITGISYLDLMVTNIYEYLTISNPQTQYQFLVEYIKADNLLDALLESISSVN